LRRHVADRGDRADGEGLGAGQGEAADEVGELPGGGCPAEKRPGGKRRRAAGKVVEGCGLLWRESECPMYGAQGAELFEARELALRLGLIEGALQLVADARAADRVDVREVAAEEVEGAFFQPEGEARLVADGAE